MVNAGQAFEEFPVRPTFSTRMHFAAQSFPFFQMSIGSNRTFFREEILLDKLFSGVLFLMMPMEFIRVGDLLASLAILTAAGLLTKTTVQHQYRILLYSPALL